MKKTFVIPFLISFLIHTCIIIAIVYIWIKPDVPLGDGVIGVEFIGDTGGATNKTGDAPTGRPDHSIPSPLVPARMGSSGGGEGKGEGDTFDAHPPLNPLPSREGNLGSGGSPSGNPILAKIRSKIERAKYYPPEARRQKLEGRPEVVFNINEDGSLAEVKITRSSGSDILDGAAISSIRRAAPFPYYKEPISLAVRFSLE